MCVCVCVCVCVCCLCASPATRVRRYYKDMQGVQVSVQGRALSFRLGKRLAQFGADYDPANPAHRITIGFSSAHDMAQLQSQVLKFLQRRR